MNRNTHLDTAPGLAEKAFTALVLLLSTGAFLNLGVTSGTNLDDSAGLLGMQIAWSVIYLLTIFLLVRHCKGFLKAFYRERLLVALVVYVALSSLWSQAPGLTFRRATALGLTCLFGVYLARRFSLRDQLELLAWCCGAALVASVLFQLFGLGAAVDQQEGWFGVYVQKNALGRMMALSALVFLLLVRVDRKHRVLHWLGVLLSFALILLSNSRTALVVFLFLLLLFRLCRLLRKSYGRAIAALVIATLAGTAAVYWAAINLDTVTEATGRNVTLTGRLSIWILSAVMALQKPWLGYGYDAFWLPGIGPSRRIWSAVGWTVPHAHNGLLEIWLELGLVGVGLFVLGYAVYVARAIRLLRETSDSETLWPLLFLAFTFLSNLTESGFLSRNTIFVLLYAACAVVVSSRESRAALRLGTVNPNARIA